MGRKKLPTDLRALARLAKRKGYSVEIKTDHIVAANNNGTIRTASMTTLKKLVG